MRISEILNSININHYCINEKEINSLGLVEYNPGDSVCTFIENEKYVQKISSNVQMVLITEELKSKIKIEMCSYGVCIVNNPRLAYFRAHNYLASKEKYCRRAFKTEIGENCSISEYAIIADKNVKIGNNVLIEEFAVIRENTVIGDNSIIRSGCKIGGEGFEFKASDVDVFRVSHVGGVVIGKNVEIQYNTCIDKAIYPWDNTVIEDYTKIDNLVHIAHAVKIGKRTMVVASSGIGGRVSIGNDSWVGFGATIRNGLKLGSNARVNMGAVVTKDIGNNASVTGNFAINHDEFIKKLKQLVV